MSADGDSTQLTAALHVVVDHLADRVVDRVMRLLELRLADRQREATIVASSRHQAGAEGNSAGLMTLAEGAGYLNIPLGTIQWFVHRTRVIAKYKIGRRVMVKREDLDALIESGSARSADVGAQAPAVKREKRSALKRRCADCGTLKPLTVFGRPDGGFDSRCRRCRDADGPVARGGVVDLLEATRVRVRRGRP
jgi:excisionase family DNA binding protein